ncbi:YT521-B, partial [Drosophila busckii]
SPTGERELMRDMADLDAVHLGLDENEADIAEELQDFDSFDTRSEASKSRGGSVGSDSEPSISSVSSAPSSGAGSSSGRRTKNSSSKSSKEPAKPGKKTSKRAASPAERDLNGKKKTRKKSSEPKDKPQEQERERERDRERSRERERERSRSRERERERSRSRERSRERSSGGKKPRAKKLNDNEANKSADLSDVDDEKPVTQPALESDSDSDSDSDSGTQHKRNGSARNKAKSQSKSSTPEKQDASGGQSGTKSYDYMTKINYLFRDTRFFLIKSNNSDNVQLSKRENVWATLPQNDANLSQAFKEARNVLLIFSVNESGKFAGFARMAAASRRDIPQVAWVLPPSISSKALGGVIELDWICRKELSFNATLHLHNSWNEGKPVKIGRDGQEIEPKIGAELCRLFPEDEQIELTPILRKSKETARVMREKGIHVIYKAPRSLSTRGHGHGGGRGNRIGPMRHKRNYGHQEPPHHHHNQRSYRHHQQHHHQQHHHPHHGNDGWGNGGFKRSGSPYRQMSGSGGGGGGGSGDMSMPSWERYMSSAAAAEAYVADYIRNMHGQLPPLPFVPSFGQMPMPGAAGAALPPGAPTSMYEQVPPPVRYYDGPGAPPLPDYPPPPQPMRPPPPGFDKSPSYEDFAAWKNAGLPTVAAPPGFGADGANMPSSGNREPGSNAGTGDMLRRRRGGGGGSSRQFRGERGHMRYRD